VIDDLYSLLVESEEPGLPDLRDLLTEKLDGPRTKGRLISSQPLGRRSVYRLSFELDSKPKSIVAKRFEDGRGRSDRLVDGRWLPAVGLDRSGPPLLGVAADRRGRFAWHIYEDLGSWNLEECGENAPSDVTEDHGFMTSAHVSPSEERLTAAVRLIADVHTRFLDHPILGECRLYGGDLGIHFFISSVRDAIRALQAVEIRVVDYPGLASVRRCLLHRLTVLLAEEAERAGKMAEHGAADTLLHGDLSVRNAFVVPTPEGQHTRLIDWDHAGVGPISYDLSNFLVRFAPEDRLAVLRLYIESTGMERETWPTLHQWNDLFDTAERARLANSIIWRAAPLLDGEAEWAVEKLVQIEDWFESMQPLLFM